MAEKNAIEKMPLSKIKGYFKGSNKNYTDEKITELILESGSVHLICVDYKGNKFKP